MFAAPSPLIYSLLAVLLLVLAVIFYKVRRFIKRFKASRIPKLSYGKIRIQQPNSEKRTGSAVLPVENTNGGEARIISASLDVVEHGQVFKAARLRHAPALPACEHQIKLRSNKQSYKLTLKNPTIAKKQTLEFKLLLTSDENEWYRMALNVVWADKRKPQETQSMRSAQFYLEFPEL